MKRNQFGINNPMFGKKLSEERKQKIRAYRHTDEAKLKISEAGKNRKMPQLTRERLYEANKGSKRSEQAIKNISNGHKGIKLSKETVRKMIEARKWYKPSEETKNKIRKANTGKKHTEESKKKIKLARSKQTFSIETRKKIGDKHRGEKSHTWKGGINPINDTIRKSLEMKLWKKACLERDDWTCQKTRQRSGKLEVHHINNFADFPELRTSIENGITLSFESHIKFHKIYGKKNNTREQLLEFLKDN